ncbi:MAG: heavy metal sensor histidine kinase [Planctomycetota bacterium]
MNRFKIRWKLTLWYGCVLAVVLMVFGTVVFVIMRHHLLQRIDQGLNEELADVLSEVNRAKTPESLKDWLDRRFAAHAGFDFQITRPNGERFFYNPRLAEKAWPLPTKDTNSSAPAFQTLPVEAKGDWRIVHVNIVGPDGQLTVQVGRSLAAYKHELSELLMTFLLAGPLTLAVAISGGYFLAGRVLRPVQEMTQAAKVISADRLSQRIAVINPHDELGELGETLNQMIERLERSFTEMRRFTADAAHELRTPLAIIRNEAEVALRLPRSSDQYCGVLENLLEDTNRLSLLADQLLFLSRQDAGVGSKANESVQLDALLREVVGNMQLMAQERGITLELTDSPPCVLTTDPRLLRRVFVNLLDNAIKYTGQEGRVVVSSEVAATDVTIQIRDSGVGISSEHLPHIFERFYRVDAARSGEENGAGLGLAICQAILRNLEGTISVRSEVGKGTTFTVTLPRP